MEAFRRALEPGAVLSRPQPHSAGLKLSAFLSLRAIPSLGAGHWAEAAREVTSFASLLCSRAAEASCRQASALSRLRLLVAPCLWALVNEHPDLQDALAPASRSDRVRRAWAVIDLFAALGRSRWPASVLLAAGALAVVARPPDARAWVQLACLTARLRGTWRLERFFRFLLIREGQ